MKRSTLTQTSRPIYYTGYIGRVMYGVSKRVPFELNKTLEYPFCLIREDPMHSQPLLDQY